MVVVASKFNLLDCLVELSIKHTVLALIDSLHVKRNSINSGSQLSSQSLIVISNQPITSSVSFLSIKAF